MAIPSVRQTERDGQLGVLAPNSRALAIVGPSSAGTLNQPAAFAGTTVGLVATFGAGPLVESAALHIGRGGVVLCVRCDITTQGASGTVTFAGTGTSVPTADAATKPYDDYDVLVTTVAGGTVGTAGITYQWSLDGGRTLSPVTALGVANAITLTDGNVKINLAAGTLVAGDTISFRTSAPVPNATQVGAALDSLRTTQSVWKLLELAFPLDATLFAAVETGFASLFAAGRRCAWIGSARTPNAGESDATYAASLGSALAASRVTKVGGMCAGSAGITSAISRRVYRRPVSFHYASLEALVDEHVDVADVGLGAATGVTLSDASGNPLHHDEALSPGLDDLGFVTLRTWSTSGGPPGVYVTRPRLFAPPTSDFQLMPLRRVMNLARDATYPFEVAALSKAYLLDPRTGLLSNDAKADLEAGGTARLRAVLGGAPKASGWSYVIDNTVNILSTKTIRSKTRVVPLGYVEFIEEDIAFENPALAAVTS